MAVGPLAGIPSPTAGALPANNMQGMAQAAGTIEQALQQRKEKAKQQAQQQLPMLLQMARAQPNNPQTQQALQAALQTLGLPVQYAQQAAAQSAPQAPQTGSNSPTQQPQGQPQPQQGQKPQGPPPPPPMPQQGQAAMQPGAGFHAPMSAPGQPGGGFHAPMAAPPQQQPQKPQQGQEPHPITDLVARASGQLPPNSQHAVEDATELTKGGATGGAAAPQAGAAPQQAPGAQMQPTTDPTHPPPLPQGASPTQQAHHGLLTRMAHMLGMKPHPESQQSQQDNGPINVDAYSPPPLPNEKQTEYLLGLEAGPTRTAAAAAMGLKIDPSFATLDQQLPMGSPGQIHAEQAFAKLNHDALTLGMTPAQYQQQLDANAKLFRAAGIDTTNVDPQVVSAMGQKTLADITAKQALGAHYAQADVTAVMRAKTYAELSAATERLDNVKAKEIPLADKMKWERQARLDSDAAQKLQGQLKRWKTLDDAITKGGPKANVLSAMKAGDADYRAAGTALENLKKYYGHLVNDEGLTDNSPTSKDADPANDPQINQVKADIANAEQTLKDADTMRTTLRSKYGGDLGLTGDIHRAGGDPNSKFSTPGGDGKINPQSPPPGAQRSKVSGNFRVPDGKGGFKMYDSQGNPISG